MNLPKDESSHVTTDAMVPEANDLEHNKPTQRLTVLQKLPNLAFEY